MSRTFDDLGEGDDGWDFQGPSASGIWRYVACLSAGASLHDCRGRIADSSFGAKLTCRSGTLLEILPNMCSHQICGSLVTLREEQRNAVEL